MPNFCANLSMLFAEHEPSARFEAAAAAGFGAVEFQWPHLLGSPDEVASLVGDAGLRFVQLNVPVGDLASGDPMTSADPGAVAEFRSGVALGLEYAAALDVDVVNVLAGDRMAGTGFAHQVQILTANLHHAAEAFAPLGVRVVTEVLNTQSRPQALLSRQREAAQVIAQVAHPNVGLQFDVFHTAMMGDDPVETFATHREVIQHVQFADSPGRHEPGTGTLDFPSIFAAIDQSGYDGWTSAEYVPGSEVTADSLGWLPG